MNWANSPPYASEVPVIVGDVVIISAETAGQTLGLDLKSGKMLWRYSSSEEKLWNYHSMGVDNKHWYCITTFRKNPKHYFAFDIKTGEMTMKVDISKYGERLGYIHSRVGLIVGDYHFVGVFDPPRIVAFNKTTGELIWMHSIDRSNLIGDSRGIFANGKLIWVRNTGDVYCFA